MNTTNQYDWRKADLFLVACVSEKGCGRAPAKDLYTSPWFTKARNVVENLDKPWYILSAEYGLVPPSTLIDPYNKTLNSMPIAKRREWADRVVSDLKMHLGDTKLVTLFAGIRYREFLTPMFHEHRIGVCVPMEGMTIGRQLSWLNQQV